MKKRQMKKQSDKVLRRTAINVINKYQQHENVELSKRVKKLLINSAVKNFKTEGHLTLHDKNNRKIFDNGDIANE